VGRARASSRELEWRDWDSPSTAASRFLAPNLSLINRAHILLAAQNLAISLRKLLWAPRKKESLGGKGVDIKPRSYRRLHVGQGTKDGKVL